MRWEGKLEGHFPEFCGGCVVAERPQTLANGKSKLQQRRQYSRSSLRKKRGWIPDGGERSEKLGGWRAGGESRQRIRNKDNLKFPEFFRSMLDLHLGWPFKETAWRFDKDNEMNRFAQDQDRMISFRQCPSMLRLPPNHNLYVRILCPLYFWPQETEDLPGRSLNY